MAGAVAAGGDGFLGLVAGDTLDLDRRGFDGVAVVGVLFLVEGPEDDAVVLADGDRGFDSEPRLLVRFALGQAADVGARRE